MSQRIGLIGLGLMGAPMARNWLAKGFQLTILPHKNMKTRDELTALGARVALSLDDLARQSDVIVLMVPTSNEVEAICLGPKGLRKFLTPDHLVIDMTTSDPISTKKIFKTFQKKGLRFFDAPVTGGVKGAEAGSLVLFIGGPVPWFEEAKPVLEAVSRSQGHFGDAGQGHVAKIINNLICIGNLQVFSEALPLAVKLGLESQNIFDTLLAGTACSEMLKVYGPQVLAGDFAPRFKLWHAHKDLKLADTVSKKYLKKPLPILGALLSNFRESEKMGFANENLSSVIKVFEKKLKVKFRKTV